MSEELLNLQGAVKSVIYRNNENGYAIIETDVDGQETIMVGTLPYINAGESVSVMGVWAEHKTYGRQFQVATYEKQLPVTMAAIEGYLKGGAIKGIGVKTADRILALFGDKSLDIIENDPHQLTRIRGITPAKAESIAKSFQEQFGIRRVLMFLQQHGIGMSDGFKIWKCWGSASEDVVRANPYILCEFIEGIDFASADRIAVNLGFDLNSPFRVSSAIKYVLLRNSYGAGHTFLPRESLVALTDSLIGAGADMIECRLDELLADEMLYARRVGNKDAVYLERFYKAEEYCAHKLLALDKIGAHPKYDEDLLGKIEKQMKISFNKRQMRAVSAAATRGVMVLTGGPGTGKTTAVSGIIALYEKLDIKYVLAAPTGRAAKRISEITGREAKTIHRLLEMQFTGDMYPHFAKNEDSPLEFDAVICDEASMIDILLLQSLLRAMPNHCRLVLVGDANQLPPVGPGNTLGDIIGSERLETVELNHIFRQAADSLIITNAHGILAGESPVLEGEKRDFFVMRRMSATECVGTVVDLAVRRLVQTYGYDPQWDIQIITPSKKGICGTVNINEHMKAAVNPPSVGKREKTHMYRTFREGDKVMQVKNNYDIDYRLPDGEIGVGVFNGDMGIIQKIDPAAEQMDILFDDRRAHYPLRFLDQLDFAYAVTVHKSQGSEFKCVVLALSDTPQTLLYRNLLYTAVTRAKEMLVIVGDPSKINRMIENRTKTKRFSGLKYRVMDDGK